MSTQLEKDHNLQGWHNAHNGWRQQRHDWYEGVRGNQNRLLFTCKKKGVFSTFYTIDKAWGFKKQKPPNCCACATTVRSGSKLL